MGCCFGLGKGWRRKVILKVLLTGTLFISVEKKLNESQSLNFTGFYRQIPGENSPNTAEVTELTENTILLGFQEGKKRNAK
jgi:hypothetical protein